LEPENYHLKGALSVERTSDVGSVPKTSQSSAAICLKDTPEVRIKPDYSRVDRRPPMVAGDAYLSATCFRLNGIAGHWHAPSSQGPFHWASPGWL